MLASYNVRDLCHFARSAGGRLQLNTQHLLTPKIQNWPTVLARRSVETHQGNELTHNSSWNAHPQLQLTEPHWPQWGLKVWNWCTQADINLKRERERESIACREWNLLWSTHEEKATASGCTTLYILSLTVTAFVTEIQLTNGSEPAYFSEVLHAYTHLVLYTLLLTPACWKSNNTKCKTHGFRTFSYFGPHIWN